MTSYLSQETIKRAVDRLGESRAKPVLIDYLVFLRALAISIEIEGSATSVTTGLSAAPYRKAIDELALVAPPESSELPYFSPFGARRDKGRGFKRAKYPSNGPSDTVSRWASKPDRPIDYIPASSPKAFRVIARSSDELEKFFLVAPASNTQQKPRLEDLAIWFYRAAELDSVIAPLDPTDPGLGCRPLYKNHYSTWPFRWFDKCPF